jgi:hypothetical protein
MGILSSLLKIGGVVAAPFSGGASLGLTALGNMGSVLGKQQEGAGNAMATQAGLTNQFDRNAIDSYGTAQDAQFKAGQQDLDRKGYEAKHQSSAAKEALLAMLMQDYKPSSISTPGIPQSTVSGGMGDMLKSPQILELLKSVAAKNSTAATAPMTFAGGNVLAPPKQTPLPQAGKSDGILNAIARIAQLAGTAAPLFKKGDG